MTNLAASMHLCSDGIINYNISNNYNKLLSAIIICLFNADICMFDRCSNLHNSRSTFRIPVFTTNKSVNIIVLKVHCQTMFSIIDYYD